MLKTHQKVFGLGLSRTGTTSLGKALNQLGIKTIHYPHDRVTYDQLAQGEYRLSILEVYQGIVDITVAPFYAQLDDVYPESKFILTVREKTSWLNSIRNHNLMALEMMDREPQFKEFTEFISACVYGALKFNESRFAYAYDTHLKNVHDYFRNRSRDFLVLDISAGDGWEKLCSFLGFGLPNRPFPHTNRQGAAGSWLSRLDMAKRDIDLQIPKSGALILVDEQSMGQFIGGDYRVMPFLERDGRYWGRPSDDEMAIGELERLRGAGARFIVFAWPAFWWLDHYAGFGQYLRSKFQLVLDNDRLIVFDMNPSFTA